MAISHKNLLKILEEKFPNSIIELRDLAGDGDHYSVTITSSIFADKTKLVQHKIVNEALKEILGTDLHALEIKTRSN